MSQLQQCFAFARTQDRDWEVILLFSNGEDIGDDQVQIAAESSAIRRGLDPNTIIFTTRILAEKNPYLQEGVARYWNNSQGV